MKGAITYPVILILAAIDFGRAQYVSLDTIFVSTDKTTYLVFGTAFDPNTDFIDIGTKEFQSKIEGETVFLKASGTATSPTTLMIKNGNTYYHGIIEYRGSPKKTFHDYRQLESAGNLGNSYKTKFSEADPFKFSGEMNKGDSNDHKEELITERLEIIMNSQVEIRTLGAVKNRITVALTNVMTDEKVLYIKILFHNKSSGKFEIDFVNFQFIEPSKRKGLKKSPKKTTDVFPIKQTPGQTIKAYQKQWLGYALPLFNISNKGKLVIVFRESNGSRVVVLEVPAKAILKTKVFES